MVKEQRKEYNKQYRIKNKEIDRRILNNEPILKCRYCGKFKKIHARGLCNTCYKWLIKHDKIEGFPRVRKKRTDFDNKVRAPRKKYKVRYLKTNTSDSYSLTIPKSIVEKYNLKGRYFKFKKGNKKLILYTDMQ